MDKKTGRKVIFSGVQPSGCLTIGNYVGAIKNWVSLQDDYKCYFCVVDMHSITVRQDPTELRKRCVSFFAQYLAAGLDPERCVLFYQSHVPAHAQLAWVLQCNTYMGELGRMTQFKEKSAKQENIGSGLFCYPVLMAADILLYQTDLVPVGADQKQHLELARDISERFNNIYGETFTVPEPYIPPIGAKIMSLQNPTAKMSKSDENENAYISLLDPPDAIMRKFKRSVTDSVGKVRYSDEQPGVQNLLTIYSAMTGKSISEAESEFSDSGYEVLKTAVAEAVIAVVTPFQKKYNELMKDKAYLEKIARQGAEQAAEEAARTLGKVYRKVGFAPMRL
ncbi:MAG TPA: tryptophan--tRNA ligase [Clostridia bacterium]|nr:tryptophan--tRNA ligase [Clostridia bacterium]